MAKALDGVKVLDFSSYFAGPYCGLLLAMNGAEVTRVEKVGGSEDRKFGPFAPNGDAIFSSVILTAQKKCITLNTRTDKGKEILEQLVRNTDVVLHNFPPGMQEEKLLSYDNLARINPKVIVTHITGFGHHGPYFKRNCFDSIAQAMCGPMSFTGFPGNPPTRYGTAPMDFSTAISATLGTTMALYNREKTGEGQFVDVSMFNVGAAMGGALFAAEYKLAGLVRQQHGNASFFNFTDCFQSGDGDWLMISAIGDFIWKRFCQVIEREDLLEDPRFVDDISRYENREPLFEIVSEWAGQRTYQEITGALEKARIPHGRVNNIAEFYEDPHAWAQEMMVNIDYPELGVVPIPGVPIKMSKTPGTVDKAAPPYGNDNASVYLNLLGISMEELKKLEEDGII
ncbi:MAG: CoA transferase [Dehalococcoidia bacterium]